MILGRLDVGNVRNIASAHLDLGPGANLLLGPNGAGKTALLEAVHLLIRGRSFRPGKPESVLRQGEERIEIGAGLQDAVLGDVRISYRRERGGRAELRRDGKPVRQLSEVAALLPIQLLLPDLADLVFGAPAVRRQWLDWGVFHVKHDHAGTLRRYARALRHRNALLKARDHRTLPSWTAQLVELGAQLADVRGSYFDGVRGEVQASLAALDDDLAVDFSYSRGWRGGALADAVQDDFDWDCRTGTTHSGPHRADVEMTCRGEAASSTLSRGQGKALASALVLGQAQQLDGLGRPSLFLIDDVGAELDDDHSQRFYGRLGAMGSQVIATSANPAASAMLRADAGGRVFHVKHGEFVPAS